MGNFRNNQIPAANPFYAGDAVPGFWGLSVIGGKTAVQANTAYDYELSEEVEGYQTIWPEVIDWPFSEDEEGVAFDQANLRGLRTRCVRLPLADGGGDNDEWWVAVPKTLPSGYTEVGRCGIIVPLYADHLGDPMIGVSWNHRTAGGLLLDTGTAEGSLRAQWGPRNRGQKTLGADVSDIYSGMWTYYINEPGATPNETGWIVAPIALTHVGFRGGRIEITLNSDSCTNTWPDSGTLSLQVVAIRADKFWDPFDADAGDQPTVLQTISVPWSFALPGDPPVTTTHTLNALIPSGIGIPFHFFLRYEYNPGVVVTGVYRSRHNCFLSPRTDIPPWLFASTRNKCVPGGIVMP